MSARRGSPMIERLPSARGAIAFSMELGKVICVPDPEEADLRDRAMIAAVPQDPVPAPALPGIAAGLLAAGSPHAGDLFPQFELPGGPFDDLHGAGWCLVTTEPSGVASLDAELVDWFARIGGTVVPIGPSTWFSDHDISWALQRPDFHLYGTAIDAPSAAALLHDLRRGLLP